MRRAPLALLLFLVAIPGVAADKWWDHYNKGVKAVNGRSYDVAVDELQKAIAETPVENNAIRARNEIITYVPHFFLGIARFNVGDVDGALREWKISEDQGAIQKTDYYSKLKDWVARAQTEKQRTAQNAAADSKKMADAALSRALSGQMEALSAGGDRSEDYRTAQRKLQEALAQFNKAGTDVRSYQRAAETAGQARDLFAAAAEAAKKQKAARPAVVAKAPPRPAPTPVPQPPAVTTTTQGTIIVERSEEGVKITQPPPKLPPVESEALVGTRIAVQQFRRRLMEAQTTAPANNEFQAYIQQALRDITQVQNNLSALSDEIVLRKVSADVVAGDRELTARLAQANVAPANVAPASAGVPSAPPAKAGATFAGATATRAQLESAYRAFATGAFDESEEQLSRIIETTQSGEAYLLRGCARYTRAMLSRNSSDLLSSASEDFRSALRINRALRLDKTAFSPKLIEFFDQVAGARASRPQ